jgi:hypothetical protein
MSLPKKLRNVIAVTDLLALSWQSPQRKKGEIAMKKIAVPLALALATGLTLTMAFASSLLPLLLT